jgi:predicted lipoprotein with Yx(FWY)xxD motif
MKNLTPTTSTEPRLMASGRKRRFGLGLSALVAGAASVGLSLTALGGPASANTRLAATSTSHVVVTIKTVTKYGAVLFDQKGLALYVDMSDKPPHFACTGTCLTFWPALVLPAGQTAAVAGMGVTGLGTIKSPSGMQVTWRHMPLYTFKADSKGTVHGQGIKQWGIWYAANSKIAQTKVPTNGNTTATTAKTTATTSSSSWA